MAWRRGRGRGEADATQTPSLEPLDDLPEMLPVITDEGTTSDRDAYKQIKRAEADLKRLGKKKAKAKKREENLLRQVDRRLARMERSKGLGPLRLMINLAVLNGIAAAYVMISFWWPEWQLVPALLLDTDHQWEVVAFCYIGFAGIAAYLLSTNPSPDHLERARHSLMVYFMLGLVAIFAGMLVGFFMADMELMGLDWLFWQWVFVYIVAGSAVPMVVIYLTAHRAGSRSFLTVRYHQVMGTLNAILVVALIILAFVYMAHTGIMEEVGISLVTIGVLMGIFIWPAMVSSWIIEYRGLTMLGLRALT
ncbi:MAG: hypothetical protein KAQ96_15505 [Thermoplasmata archaeon]|nr:hypothetical protein [Thermoplasmata archaeon]